MIKLKKRKNFDRSAEITSLIDVVFILLIFFLLTAVYSPRGLNLDLAQAKSATAQDQQSSVILSITEAGEIFLNGKELTLGELEKALKSLSPQDKIILEGDRHVDYGKFVQVVDRIRQNGNHPLVLAADLPDPSLK